MSTAQTPRPAKARKKVARSRAEVDPKDVPLTDEQADVLEYIDRWIEADALNRSPAVRRIAAALGLPVSTTFRRVEMLKERGVIDGLPWVPCSLSLTERGKRLAAAWRGTE